MNLFGSLSTATGYSEVPCVSFAIIGGSGFCAFPEAKEISRTSIETPYGKPSSDLVVMEHEGIRFVFLPRHGGDHLIAPHRIPYRANMAALKSLGVQYVVGMCIGGSLRLRIEPGHFIVPDQFVNLTWGRDEACRVDGTFLHLPMADPYCDALRNELTEALVAAGTIVHRQGTVAVIQGPRFSTRAESKWLSKNGWDVVNMTQYPECYFARDFGMCYASAIAITDYDVGIPSSINISSANMERVLEVFHRNVGILKRVALALTASVPRNVQCSCATQISAPFYQSKP